MNHVGYHLRVARERAALSQSQAAKLCGWDSANCISQWECGRTAPGLANLIRLAGAYRCTLDRLVGRVRRERK